MTIFAISCLGISLLAVTQGLYVYFKDKKSPITQAWCFVSICVSIWCFGYFKEAITQDYEIALFWIRFLYYGVIFIPIGWLKFELAFLNQDRAKLIKTIWIISFIFAVLNFSNILIKSVSPKFPFKYYTDPNYVYNIFLLLWCISIIYSLFIIYSNYRLSSGSRKIQIGYVLIAGLVGFIGGSTNFLLVYGIPIYPFGQFLVIFYPIVIYIAIAKHRLMDISIIIRKGLIYTILTALISSIYLIFVLIIERLLNRFIGYTSVVAMILTAFTIALIFIPLKNKIQYIVDHLFFKGTLDSLAKERELMRQELTYSERLKAVATLAAGMAHEIKNPLTAIKTFTEHLREKNADPAFIEKFEKIVGGEVDKINRLVHQLLDFSKPAPIKLEPVDVNNILDETLSLLSNDILKCKINPITKYSQLHTIEADPNQLKQAFLNLMLNAIEAMPEGGRLIIETRNRLGGDGIEIIIQDTGRGIPKKDLKSVFDPFYSTKDAGTGLGLSITQDIIKKHKGMITLESWEKRGTIVRIRL